MASKVNHEALRRHIDRAWRETPAVVELAGNARRWAVESPGHERQGQIVAEAGDPPKLKCSCATWAADGCCVHTSAVALREWRVPDELMPTDADRGGEAATGHNSAR